MAEFQVIIPLPIQIIVIFCAISLVFNSITAQTKIHKIMTWVVLQLRLRKMVKASIARILTLGIKIMILRSRLGIDHILMLHLQRKVDRA